MKWIILLLSFNLFAHDPAAQQIKPDVLYVDEEPQFTKESSFTESVKKQTDGKATNSAIELLNDKGNGGDAIVCGPKKGDRERIVKLADLHDAFVRRDLINTEFWDSTYTQDQAQAAMVEEMKKYPQYYKGVEDALKTIRFVFVEELEELNDDDITYVSSIPVLTLDLKVTHWKCRKQQLAIQDRTTGIVRVNARLYGKLNPVERAFLWVHEALIYLTGDTNRTRYLVDWLFDRPGFSLNYESITEEKLAKINLGKDESSKRIIGIFARSISSRWGENLSLTAVIDSLSKAATMGEFLRNHNLNYYFNIPVVGYLLDDWRNRSAYGVTNGLAMNLIRGGLCVDADGVSYLPTDGDIYGRLWTIIADEAKVLTKKSELEFSPERYILRASKRLCSEIIIRGYLK